MKKTDRNRIDWMVTLVPFILIMGLAIVLFLFSNQANTIISQVRFFFGDTIGIYYLIMGLGVLIISLFLAFSKYEILYWEGRMKLLNILFLHGAV